PRRRQLAHDRIDHAADVGHLRAVLRLRRLRLGLGEGLRAELVQLLLRDRADVLLAPGRRGGGGAGGQQRRDRQSQQQVPARSLPGLHRGPLRSWSFASLYAHPPKWRVNGGQISRLATFSALSSLNSRRGSTTSPIRVLKIASAATASSIFTCSRRRVSGLTVVSHSCSGFI